MSSPHATAHLTSPHITGPHITSPHITDSWIDLAEAVVADGFDRHETTIDSLIAAAHQHGVSDVLLGILADRSAPRPVRERALGRVVVAMMRQPSLGRAVGEASMPLPGVTIPDHIGEMFDPVGA